MLRDGSIVRIGVIPASVFGFWVDARLLVDATIRSARRFGLSELIIGLAIVVIRTPTPEPSAAVDTTCKRLGDIAVASILGSNIYSMAFVLGVISLLQVIPVAELLIPRDDVALLVNTFPGELVLFNLRVTRLEGTLLVAAFVAYTAYLLRGTRAEVDGATEQSTEQSADQSLGNGDTTRPMTDRVNLLRQDAVFFADELALVLVNGDYMMPAASEPARGAGVPQWVIDGTITTTGTSTLKFAASLVVLRQRGLGVSASSVIGSNILNITGIVDVVAVVRPFVVSASALETFAQLVAATLLIVTTLWTGKVPSRMEDAPFVTSETTRWILRLI